jgi:hydroxypyruvate isomerase
MGGRPVDQQKKIGDTLAKLGMSMGVFVQPGLGNDSNLLASGKAEYIDKFVASCKEAVEVAKRINGKLITVVPGDFVRNLPIGIQTGNVIEAIKKGTAIIEPHGLIMVLEPLSDNPRPFFTYTRSSLCYLQGSRQPILQNLVRYVPYTTQPGQHYPYT